jgi:A/G-specific adenine glycosylase
MNLKKLIKWSRKEFSHLPWRKERTLYITLVSEIMLQQTTVSTVQKHFSGFIKRFPSLEDLALASEEELLIAWKGLGYYRRARNLKKIAEHLLHHHQGQFPGEEAELRLIPGIGPYTSQALIGIGRDERALAIDANLERVLSRLYGIKLEKGLKLQKKIAQLFLDKKILNEEKYSYRDINEALMDLGRVYCQARKVSCELCPLSEKCVAFSEGKPFKYPLQNEQKSKIEEDHTLHLLRLIIIKKDKLLTYKKNEDEWLAGQYEVPTILIKSTDPKLKQYVQLKSEFPWTHLKMFKTGITKYKIENYVCVMDLTEFKKIGFPRPVEWRDFTHEGANLSTATIKALKFYPGH